MLQVINPFDLTVIDEIRTDDAATLEAMVARASAFHRTHPAGLSAKNRLDVLHALQERMRAEFDLLCETALREGGKPLRDTRVEVERAIDGIGLAIDALRAGRAAERVLTAKPSGDRFNALRENRPIGPVAALSAFNHPLNLIVHQAIPAFATGCPVIVKPSEKTPRSALLLQRLIREAGCPEDAWQTFVTDNLLLVRALIVDPRIAFVSFIGSAQVGWELRRLVAPGTRIVMEHGGVAPAVLLEDVDLDAVVPKIVHGAFYHAGQVCVSLQRLIVPRRRLADVVDLLREACSALRVGDPADPATELGPMIRPSEVSRIADWIAEARPGGGKIVAGGERISDTLHEATVVVRPPRDSRLWVKEAFGPVLAVAPYKDMADAIALARHPAFAFQSAVFGRDPRLCRGVARHLPGSTVIINEHTAFRTDDMPFAGLGQSGLGVGGIGYTMRDMWVERQTVERAR